MIEQPQTTTSTASSPPAKPAPRITDLASAAAYVRSVPYRFGKPAGGRRWSDDVDGVALLAACLLQQQDPRAACRELGLLVGTTGQAFESFIRGHDASAARWPALRDRLTAMGVRWIPDSREGGSGRPPKEIAAKPSAPPSLPAAPSTLPLKLDLPKPAAAGYPSPEAAVAIVRGIQRGEAGRVKWQEHFADCLAVVQAILASSDPRATIAAVAAGAKCRVDSLRCLAMGQTPSGRPWSRLRKHLRRSGLAPLAPLVNRPRAAAALTSKPANGRDHAPPPAPAPISAAPQADTPTPRVRYTWGIVDGTDDIEVVEVSLLRYGTPEHRAFVREHLATMGTARPPSEQ